MSQNNKLLIVLILIPIFTFAGTFGSKGLIHVQTASTLERGTLDFRTNMRFYTKLGEFLGQNKPLNFSTVNYWDVQGNILLSYGVMDHFDVTLQNRVYQDIHQKGEYNSPEDLFLDLKVGSFGINNNTFHVGFMTELRLPTGKTYNYPFELYTAGAFEVGLKGLVSYHNDPYLPDRSWSIHGNLGWYTHNDSGRELFRTATQVFTSASNSTDLQFGLGFCYPTELFNLNAEIWGIGYINQPDTMVYSRESFMYFTPSVRFKPKSWFSFDLGLDIRISGDNQSWSKLLPNWRQTLNLPMYPSWNVHLGANFRLMPIVRTSAPGSQSDIRTKVDFFESLMREREKTKSIEEELRRLKREREQAEKELEELRQMLEEQEK